MDRSSATETDTSREAYLRRRVTRLSAFYRHAMLYMTIVAGLWVGFLFAKDMLSSEWWRGWLIGLTVGWGLSLIVHALGVLPRRGLFSLDWEEKKVRELLLHDPQQKQSSATTQSPGGQTTKTPRF